MPPPDTLLHCAYDTIVARLQVEHGVLFDRDYAVGQVDYQEGNTALFQNGTDRDLKEFARHTLPKIELRVTASRGSESARGDSHSQAAQADQRYCPRSHIRLIRQFDTPDDPGQNADQHR